MKNILYIGPYRQNTFTGLLSYTIIKNINTKYQNITTRPLYLDDCSNNEALDIANLEDNIFATYDVLIQHAPISQATVINCIKNNIIIPILEQKVCGDHEIKKLSQFNKILVDNQFDYEQLSKYPKLKNKLYRYDFKVDLPKKQARVNIGLYNQFPKICSIVDNNTDTVFSIVTAFNLFNKSGKYVLLLFIQNLLPETKHSLDKKIENLCNNMGVASNKNKILTFKAEYDLDTLFAIHNVSDIYIPDISIPIGNKIGEILNKNVLNLNSSDYTVTAFDNNQYFLNGKFVISSDGLKNKLFSKQSKTKTHFKMHNISDII